MKNKLKKFASGRVGTLIGVLLFIALCAAVGMTSAYIRHESDPTDEAVEYFRAFVQGDYEKMYKCLGTEKGTYVNKDLYEETMKSLRGNMEIDSYEIEKPEKKNGRKAVTIRCTDTDTDTSQDFTVYFTARRKLFQIIPDYYVNIDHMLVKNFSVKIPKGYALTINGEKITDRAAEITENSDGSKSVRFNYILNGEYSLSAYNDYFALNDSLNLKKKDTNVDLTSKTYTANSDYAKQVGKSGKNVLKLFYKAVRNRNKNSRKLIACFANDKKLKSKVRKCVEKSQDVVYWEDVKNIDNYKVINMKMSELKSVITADTKNKTYKIAYNYNYSYTSATDTELYTSYVYKISGKCTAKMQLVYKIGDDGKLTLKDISVENKNKKNK